MQKDYRKLARLNKTLLTQQCVKELFAYDPDTGTLTWRSPLARRLKPGDEAGTIHKTRDGLRSYRMVNIKYVTFGTHRLVWLYVHGTLPEEIDHVDGNGLNNRISNLRVCTRSQNSANKRAYSTNKSGYKGVSFCKATGRWRASITIDRKVSNLGRYGTPEEAHAVYAAKAEQLFGVFARLA